MAESDRSDDPASDREGERDAPPIERPDGAERPEATTAEATRPPVWAAALRYQLLGVLALAAGGFVAVSTAGVASLIAETVAILGVVLGLFGFYAWPRSASNNS